MCEWVDVCPWTWKSIEHAPCNAAINFWIPVQDTLDWVWENMRKTLEADERFIKTIRN